MILLCDSSPLIFLGKIDQLGLIQKLFNGEVLVPKIIKKELLTPLLPPEEERSLIAFLTQCKIIEINQIEFSSKSLSYADNCILTFAVKHQVDVLLSDDRLVRRIASNENIKLRGTLGILLQAMKKSLLTPKNTRKLINDLIHEHKFRISIDVFESVLRVIESYKEL